MLQMKKYYLMCTLRYCAVGRKGIISMYVIDCLKICLKLFNMLLQFENFHLLLRNKVQFKQVK